MNRYITLVIVGLIIGTFVTLQAKSFKSLDQVLVGRDSHTNVFQEIQILLQTNENLEQEISDLKTTFRPYFGLESYRGRHSQISHPGWTS
jgi:hypothetical protein